MVEYALLRRGLPTITGRRALEMTRDVLALRYPPAEQRLIGKETC